MAPNAPNVAGIAAPVAEIKPNMQMVPIKHAAPMPKHTKARAIFSAKPMVMMVPPGREYTQAGGGLTNANLRWSLYKARFVSSCALF